MSLSLFPESIHLDLLHPVSKEPTGLKLELVSPDNDDVYQATLDVIKSLRAKGVKETTDFVHSLDAKIKIAAASIKGWEVTSDEWTQVFKKLGFEDATFTTEKAVALISKKEAGWIRNAINEAVGEKERFFGECLEQLTEALKTRIRLDTPSSDGFSKRDHLLAVSRMGAPRPKELDIPTEPPGMFQFVWMVFQKLNRTRQWTQYSSIPHPQPINHQEILAWCSLYDEKLSRGDVDIIHLLDNTFINTRNELARELQNG